VLARTRLQGAQLDERMPCWREVLQLAEEFYEPPTESTIGNDNKPGTVSSSPPLKGKGSGKGAQAVAAKPPLRKTAIAATSLMSTLYQTFQRQMDGIAGNSRDATMGTNGKRKNNQQDAVECLTFLLDALHEEIIHTEAENARLAAEAAAASANKVSAFSRDSSTHGAGNMSGDDFDLIPFDSRQNSFEMVIALSRQNSLATQQPQGQDADDGWSTVTPKAVKKQTKAVVVDTASKERADSASSASIISRLFHATLR
jgi:hypothetical protein